ncbi:MAG: hypothetical protein AABW89_02890 [Nanoarchaeota archaeon]
MIKLKLRYFLTFAILVVVAFLLIYNFNTKYYFGNPKYEYEVCDDGGECKYISIDKIIEPSSYTFNVCNNQGLCEDVPVNRLLLKHGTDKKYCADAPYLASSYVDNWWNSNGLIDECEMPPRADMQFAFKQHNGTLSSYTGTIQITVTPINYERDYLALQVLVGEDNNYDNLPDEWVFCGNVDSIIGKDKKIINCKGTNLKFVKIVNPEWNPSSIYLDYILVLKYD